VTLPKDRQASNKIEKEQLIQDIRKMNPDISKQQLERYDIDDLQKIKMANTPQPNIGNTAGRPKMKTGDTVNKAKQLETFLDSAANRLAESEFTGSGGRRISHADKMNAYQRISSIFARASTDKLGMQKVSDYINNLNKPKPHQGLYSQPKINNTAGRPKMQQGGMADMSAAPMVKPIKKQVQSGFSSKYSKGGGVRPANYKL
tara:strand:- start:589 stop:1197 length:609 start_codon:yes stop_codon:yes gene_type:complete